MKKRVFIYIRVSTQEQADEGYSLGEQEERLRKYCEAMEWVLVKVYTDGGFSGSNMDRPALKAMIAAVEKGEADIVLVDKLDRLSRSQFDTLYLIQKVFQENDVAFVSRAEAFDTSTAFGRAMVGILAVFAELERERIKERMKDGQEGRAKEGKWKGGHPPTGYDYNKKTGYLDVNPYEAEQVKMVFELFNNRTPLRTIVNMMNEKGYRTKYGEWKVSSTKQILESRAYLGEFARKGKWFATKHDPIISEETWQRANQILEERKKSNDKFKPGRMYKSPLGSLVWCGHCGARYQTANCGKYKDGSAKRFYRCYSRSGHKDMTRDPNCKNKTYKYSDLENVIYDEVRKLKSNPAYLEEICDSVDRTALKAAAEKRVVAIDNQLNKLIELFTVGSLDMATIKQKSIALSEEKETLLNEIEAYKTEEISRLGADKVIHFVDMFEAAVSENDSARINSILHELIEQIIIKGEKIEIHWNF